MSIYYPENEGSRFLQNVGQYLQFTRLINPGQLLNLQRYVNLNLSVYCL